MVGQTDADFPRSRPRTVSLGAIAIGLWVMLVIALAYVWLRRPPTRSAVAKLSTVPSGLPAATAPSATSPISKERILALLVSQRIADLHLPTKPKGVLLPQDLALKEALAIKQGDYEQADRIAEGVLAQSHIQSWAFYPFNDFIGNIVRYEDPKLLKGLNEWAARDPRSAIAYLIRGSYYYTVGWITRGDDAASEVPRRQMTAFQEELAKASRDFRTAIERNPKIPLSYFELLRAVSEAGNTAEAHEVFQAGVKSFPRYYPLYSERLDQLSPRWYGSPVAMYDFIDRYARQAPSNSPIKLLYLQLYVNLLQTAGDACDSLSADAKTACVAGALGRMTRPELLAGMLQALKLYKSSDPTQFTTAVWPLLGQMCAKCYGSAAVTGVLQEAASIMGSDNRLMDKPTHNSYMLDDITARVWSQIGNTANAYQKYREALRDVEQTSFPDPGQKAVALATILGHMARFADDTSQFIDMIVYLKAENEVAGRNFSQEPFGVCYAYYRMRYFSEAVRSCSALINGNGNYLLAHYWRGKAYEGLGQWDASIADFTPVADTGNDWFRVGAALDISYDFGQKGDFAGQLASMNRYSYLFDPNLQSAQDLAVAYNNRCYAYMKLGQLRKALNDCTTSLKYGRIPDALEKEQKLLKRLGNRAIPFGARPAPTAGKSVSIRPT